ncbi:hypothetical protein MMC20_006466 [Loxospora ochrophaea]|nr:hypothetical protein [Loxospora ochrophaea]
MSFSKLLFTRQYYPTDNPPVTDGTDTNGGIDVNLTPDNPQNFDVTQLGDNGCDNNDCGGGLSTGSIIGIVIGGLLIIAIIMAIIICIRRRRRNQGAAAVEGHGNGFMARLKAAWDGHGHEQEYPMQQVQ